MNKIIKQTRKKIDHFYNLQCEFNKKKLHKKNQFFFLLLYSLCSFCALNLCSFVLVFVQLYFFLGPTCIIAFTNCCLFFCCRLFLLLQIDMKTFILYTLFQHSRADATVSSCVFSTHLQFTSHQRKRFQFYVIL